MKPVVPVGKKYFPEKKILQIYGFDFLKIEKQQDRSHQ